MSPEVQAIHFQTILTALVTFIVGLGAFLVYIWQKHDRKKTAARILLIEIENAERQLSNIKNMSGNSESLPENGYLMPTSSWEKYRHLFGRDFTSREWDAISDFYNRCAQFDKAVTYDASSLEYDIEALRISVKQSLALGLAITILGDTSAMSEDELDAAYVNFANKLVNIYMKAENLYMYKPKKPLNEATKAIKDLNDTISLTSVGDKFRKISKPSLISRIFTNQS